MAVRFTSSRAWAAPGPTVLWAATPETKSSPSRLPILRNVRSRMDGQGTFPPIPPDLSCLIPPPISPLSRPRGHDTCCAAAVVVSFGTHLLTAQSSAAPSERRLRLRLASDNLLLLSSVGKAQQGSSLSRAATSSVPKSVGHYTQKHVSNFFWSPCAHRHQIRHAPDLAGGTRGHRGSFSWGVSVLGWEGLKACIASRGSNGY